jgi:hypothetical protein
MDLARGGALDVSSAEPDVHCAPEAEGRVLAVSAKVFAHKSTGDGDDVYYNSKKKKKNQKRVNCVL